MAAPPVSLIIVSRNRPRWLNRCLIAVGQLDYPMFEVIVVSCPLGSDVARASTLSADISVIDFDEANISKARNIGISNARGEIVAFLDDDAVPEPTWLTHLIAAFEKENVAQAGGMTLGSNGISVQHAAALVTETGQTIAFPLDSQAPCVVPVRRGTHPRLHGTNMAIRRSVLLAHQGFDPRFSFYLDETDLTLRVSQAGGVTMHVPNAVVHHGNGPSAFRGRDRTPRRLFEIGASMAVFHRKHTPKPKRDAARVAFLKERHNWLLQHMQKGTLGPDDVRRLFSELADGYDFGWELKNDPDTLQCIEFASKIKIRSHRYHGVSLVARPRTRRSITSKAVELAQRGKTVTVFDLDTTSRFHRVTFTNQGIWWHNGGIFGRENRDEPWIQLCTRNERITRTTERLAEIRPLSNLLPNN